MQRQYPKSPNAHYNAPTLCLNERIWWWCTCTLVLLFMVTGGLGDYPVTNTKWGFIRGKWSWTVRNQTVANFLGIPYALPPVGNLRFKSPQRWNRVWMTDYDATFDREKCVQWDRYKSEIVGNEDCLYLNIFVPYIPDTSQEKLSVMVMVHGGGYNTGSSDSKLLAPDYLLDQKVILVTMNYRLNALGFFSTTNKISPGNYGLKDIQMALKWIQENIHSFKGNPRSVTLMGHSAGAGATHLLALSNKTEGLFHRYILHSGSALGSWTYHPTRTYRQYCLELARRVGCLPKIDDDIIMSNETTNETSVENYIADNDEDMMKCMTRINAREIIRMANSFRIWKDNPMCVFGPTLEDDSEDAVVTMPPLQIMKAGLFRDIPAIIQVVQDEGLLKSLVFFTDLNAENDFLKNFEEYLPPLLEYEPTIFNMSVLAGSIKDFYFKGNIMLNFKSNITDLVSDAVLIWPIYQALQYQLKKGNSSIYLSFFAYEGTFSYTFSSGIPIHYGISHGDDLNYLFPILNNKHQDQLLHNTENDIAMINIMTEMWTNFAKEGVPRAWQIPAWPDYRDHHEFMRFGIDISPDIVVQTDFLSNRMEFWEKLSANMSAESIEHDSFPLNPPPNTPPDAIASANVVGLTTHFLSLIIIFCFVYK
ncbi:esterase FE4 [Ooceraea biroi]|uniref:esterase FE4 n=1 Tax=Ooceraea biroi TaxID=2015173 RepID=UPI000F07BBD7|nr:esterase FE4 [Ooceraea biroi]